MKNIYIIPTDKPSKLLYNFTLKSFCIQKESEGMFVNDGKVSGANFWSIEKANNNGFRYVKIYITNDEEPKDGDWVIEYIFDNLIFKVYSTTSEFVKKSKFHSLPRNHCKKIILTTDTELIADGVQSIPDDFLEWFVKNQSCEFVEVKQSKFYSKKDFIDGKDAITYSYKIIIPSEEQTINVSKPHNIVIEGVKCEKQETIEEAIERLYGSFEDCKEDEFKTAIRVGRIDAFYDATKWQQEQNKNLYSEEEVIKSFDNLGFKKITSEELNSQPYQPFITDVDGNIWVIDKEKWFNQFKKQ